MSWPFTIWQAFALWGLVQLICAVVFAEMCWREIDEGVDGDDGEETRRRRASDREPLKGG